MNICEKINFIKQANIFFNYGLNSIYSNSWKVVTCSLKAEDLASDEFNDFLLEMINMKEMSTIEVKIPSEDADDEIKKAVLFNYFCMLNSSYMSGNRFNEKEYYDGDFHTLFQERTLPNIPTKSYGAVIEKYVNNIIKLEKADLLSEIRQDHYITARGDILTYLDLWARRFGQDRELKILNFIIDNNLSRFFNKTEEDDKFKYIDKLLSILCSTHPQALEIKEKVENDPYLKNRFNKYELILSNSNIEKPEIKFTQKNLPKVVNSILDNGDLNALITLLESVEYAYAGNNDRIKRIQKNILSKLIKFKKFKGYNRNVSTYFNNFSKLLDPKKPYKEILKELVYEELKYNNQKYSYWRRRDAEEHIVAIFARENIIEKLKVYNLYANSFSIIRGFQSLFFSGDNKVEALKDIFAEWNKRIKDDSLTEEAEQLLYSTYDKLISEDPSYYYSTYCSNLIGDIYTNSYIRNMYNGDINRLILYYFLIKDNKDFLDVYLYYKENKKFPSLLRYLEKENKNDIVFGQYNNSSMRRMTVLTVNTTDALVVPVFTNIFIVIFLCMFKKLISENEHLDSLCDPLHEYICFNAKFNPNVILKTLNRDATDIEYQFQRIARNYTAYQTLLTSTIILSRNYTTSYELEHDIIEKENEKLIASSYPGIIIETVDGSEVPVYRVCEGNKNFNELFIDKLDELKCIYGENYKVETLKILLDEVFDHLFNGEYMDYLLNKAESFAVYYKDDVESYSAGKDLVTCLKEFTHSLNVDYLVDTYSKFFDIDKSVYNEKKLMELIDDSSTVFGLVENTVSN